MSQAPESKPKAGPEPDPATFVPVRTTLPRLPLPPNSARKPVVTERLILRPPTVDDLDALHVLRTQPEVMLWTMAGVPDADLAETRAKLELFLPPRDVERYNCAICLRETGELIGFGGCHNWRSSWGWPEVGYMIRKEQWGKGLGTEFLKGFVHGIWDGLEREVVDGLLVDARAADAKDSDGNVREQLIAITADTNGRSHGVLEKSGFEWFVTWEALDTVKGSGPGQMIDLPTYRYFPVKDKAE